MIRTDCFAYVNKNGHEGCKALKELNCKNENCKFYRNDITQSEIEHDVREYSTYKK